MLPDAVTVVDVDVTAAVVVTGLRPVGSPPPAEVVAVTAGRLANSPVPVLSAKCYKNNGNRMSAQQKVDLKTYTP